MTICHVHYQLPQCDVVSLDGHFGEKNVQFRSTAPPILSFCLWYVGGKMGEKLRCLPFFVRPYFQHIRGLVIHRI